MEVNFLLETPKIFIQHRGHNQKKNKNFFFYYAVIPKVGFLKTTFLKKKVALRKRLKQVSHSFSLSIIEQITVLL